MITMPRDTEKSSGAYMPLAAKDSTAAVVHYAAADVEYVLSSLGLDEQALREAAKHGYLARSNCTANHPPLYPSFIAWGETVRVLRDQLATKGWVRNDESNYSRVVHPEGHTAIAVATGNEATGIFSSSPGTKSPKGPHTVEAIEANLSRNLWLMGMDPSEWNDHQDDNPVTTWILLTHYAFNEIRGELSLPSAIGPDGRINGWRKRVILKPIPLDHEPLDIIPPSQPDIEIEIRRRA